MINSPSRIDVRIHGVDVVELEVPAGSRSVFFLMIRQPPISTLFPYATLFRSRPPRRALGRAGQPLRPGRAGRARLPGPAAVPRSEEHTSELQSHHDLVCRL